MTNTIYHIAAYLALFTLVCSIFIGLLKFREIPPALKIFYYYLLWNLGIELGAKMMIEMGYNNLPLLHLYTLGEFLLFSFFYLKLFPKNNKFQFIQQLFIKVVAILIIANSIFIQSIYEFNSFAKTLVQQVIIFYTLKYLFHLTKEELTPKNSQYSLQVINSAVLVYYAGSSFIFLFSNYFYSNKIKIPIEFWMANAIFNLIFQIVIFWTLWKTLFSPKMKSSF